MRDLLEQYVPRVFRFALRLANDHHAAEDLTQETMLRAWKHRGRLRDPKRSLAWLFRIAVNVWRDAIRRQHHPVSQTVPLDVEVHSSMATPDRAAAAREDARRALDAMNSLPARQREVLYLHACEGLRHEEIADVLAISAEAVKANLSLARKKMREQLNDIFPEPATNSVSEHDERSPM